ncbi:MAG TPA: glycoside hydrolase family 57 protein [Vicinamibacteria bacterium]
MVRVAFLWHMHQPLYRDPIDGAVILPWVRLHALKDYLGMVQILEETPSVHVTFNLVPVLVDQVEACARGEADDPHQLVSMMPAAEMDEAQRLSALKWLFMAQEQNVIGRHPRFKELLAQRGPRKDEGALRAAAPHFSVQDLLDLQVLAKLAWFDLEWQEKDPAVHALVAKGRGFTEADKRALAEREKALLGEILPAYRRAAERGQVELSVTPYYHPILPLLCDTDAHREAHPEAAVPRRFRHPEDALDQIQRAQARHAEAFGRPPAGMWPSEGSVSEEAVLQMARAGLRWTASDEAVLERSLGRTLQRDQDGVAQPADTLYRPWRRDTEAGPIAVFFRDHTLSDLIGFTYSHHAPEAAAADLLQRLRKVGESWRGTGLAGDPVVGIFLDGENAWEHYRDGGRTFLRAVYRGIAEDPKLKAVTLTEALAGEQQRPLARVFAGSWIHADFSVWIGHADDRRAWELLGNARDALSAHAAAAPAEQREKAWESYRAACGSDWCWWYGDDRHSENDYEFDRLFRRLLQSVYLNLGLPVPEALLETIISTRRFEARARPPRGEVHPTIDGTIVDGEWDAAGVHRAARAGSMGRSGHGVQAIRFGLGEGTLYLLVETSAPAQTMLASSELVVSFDSLRYRVGGGTAALRREQRNGDGWVETPSEARSAAGAVLEIGIPLAELTAHPKGRIDLRVLLRDGETEVERHPEVAPLKIPLEVTR